MLKIKPFISRNAACLCIKEFSKDMYCVFWELKNLHSNMKTDRWQNIEHAVAVLQIYSEVCNAQISLCPFQYSISANST